MPELPEVEHAMRRVRDAMLGREIVGVDVYHPAQRRALSRARTRALVGDRVVGVTRRAKLQLITLASGRTIEVHFRMNGDWDFGGDDDPPPRHERVRFTLGDGTRVSLVDSRALSVVRVHDAGALELPALGPEPLDPAWSADALARSLASRRAPIKPVLLDQRVVAGLGNIYAAEALWEARIDPRTPAATLSKARITRLHAAIRTVLDRAPAARYYGAATADGAPADTGWRVYDREGEPCARCGSTIRRIVQGGRSTCYCPRCQR